jgi:hypothetical protein
MIIYKMCLDFSTKQPSSVFCESIGWIPYDPNNSDYQNFKTQINDESAQLETADGVLMTADEAKVYVATLP